MNILVAFFFPPSKQNVFWIPSYLLNWKVLLFVETVWIPIFVAYYRIMDAKDPVAWYGVIMWVPWCGDKGVFLSPVPWKVSGWTGWAPVSYPTELPNRCYFSTIVLPMITFTTCLSRLWTSEFLVCTCPGISYRRSERQRTCLWGHSPGAQNHQEEGSWKNSV